MSDQWSVSVDDAQAVLWSAEILKKSEFDVFEMAYRTWYRETPDVARLECIFADYMFTEAVPFWVRQFTRATLEEHDEWQWHEQMAVHEYVRARLSAASTTALSTVGLTLSLFLPRLAFPGIDANCAVLSA